MTVSDNYYESKKRWNATNYKQLNLSIKPELLESFKATCDNNGYSMRYVLIKFITSYAATPLTPKISKQKYNGRGYRRKAVKSIIDQLSIIRDDENYYIENIPENLQNSSRYSSAEETVDILDEAIELLNDAFA